jgi:hypothetical protein
MTSPKDLRAREEWYMGMIAREIGIRKLYNSFFSMRNIRNEFGIVSHLSGRGGMIHEFLY